MSQLPHKNRNNMIIPMLISFHKLIRCFNNVIIDFVSEKKSQKHYCQNEIALYKTSFIIFAVLSGNETIPCILFLS